MLVEDDDPVRIFGARALRNKGYRVIEAKAAKWPSL
jgi:two-component system cell cycle sensor histidine kinase/response regulator CckA